MFRYGDITPKSTEETIVAILCIIWGVLVFGYILGALSSLLTNFDARRTSYISRLNVIKTILKDAKASSSLKSEIFGYYNYIVSGYVITIFIILSYL